MRLRWWSGERVRAPRIAQEVASAITAVSLEQQPRPLLIGERINAQGSRKLKRLLLEERYDEIASSGASKLRAAHTCSTCAAR